MRKALWCHCRELYICTFVSGFCLAGLNGVFVLPLLTALVGSGIVDVVESYRQGHAANK